MKNALLFFIVTLLSFFVIKPAIAHQDYSPFILINEKYGTHNPISDATPGTLEVEHEIAPDNYPVLKPVHFRIDTFKLGKPIDWIKQSTFTIDFGDGEKEQGVLQAEHIYKTIGTFKVSVYAQLNREAPQLLTTLRVHVIPLQNYRLLVSAIRINGNLIDKETDFFTRFEDPVSLDATVSRPGSSKIIKYTWDLGDGTSNSNTQLEHAFNKGHYNSFVILRVEDEKGFISDSSVRLVNQSRLDKNPPDSKTGLNPAVLIGTGLIILLLLALIIWRIRSK